MAKRKKSSADTVKINFGHKDAKDGGGFKRIPSGDYVVKVTKVKKEESQSGNPMLIWDFQVTEGKRKGAKLRDRTMLMPKNLWVLRNLLQSAGKKVPDSMVSLNIKNLVGVELGVHVEDGEPYEGRVRSEVKDYISPDVVRGDDVEDDEDEDDLDDEDEDDDDDDEEEDDEDEDEEDDDDEDLDEVDLEDEL